MGGAKKFVGRFFHSGGRKPRGGRQPPDIQQSGGDDGEHPNNRDSQLQELGSGKDSVRSILRSLAPFTKSPRSDPEATATGHARPPSQPDTVVCGTLARASGRINTAASPKGLIPAGQDPVLSSGESQHPPATPTDPPPDSSYGGLGSDDTLPHIHCSPPPPEIASAGNPKVSATDIPTSDSQGIVTTTITPTNRLSQTPVTPASELQALSAISQAVQDANRISDTKNSPSTVNPSIPAHLWQKALEIAQESLIKYKLPLLELGSLQSQSAVENIQSLVAELETAHQGNKDRQWRYKDRDGNEVVLVERLGKILKSVNKYATIVDTAIQHHPDITSLVWAGARTILLVCYGLSGGSSSLISGRLP